MWVQGWLSSTTTCSTPNTRARVNPLHIGQTDPGSCGQWQLQRHWTSRMSFSSALAWDQDFCMDFSYSMEGTGCPL